jgi:hypothetical protein
LAFAAKYLLAQMAHLSKADRQEHLEFAPRIAFFDVVKWHLWQLEMPVRRQVSAVNRERDRLVRRIVFEINVGQRRETAVSKNNYFRHCKALHFAALFANTRWPSTSFSKIEEDAFAWKRNETKTVEETALDGMYVVRNGNFVFALNLYLCPSPQRSEILIGYISIGSSTISSMKLS